MAMKAARDRRKRKARVEETENAGAAGICFVFSPSGKAAALVPGDPHALQAHAA